MHWDPNRYHKQDSKAYPNRHFHTNSNKQLPVKSVRYTEIFGGRISIDDKC